MSIKKIQKFLKKQKIHKFINKQKVQKFINKHLYKIILVVFIAFMITNPRNKLFKHLITYKNTLLGKMISVIVILYVSSKNITYGILLGVIFMITLFIYNKKRFEHFSEDQLDKIDSVDVGVIEEILDRIDSRYNVGKDAEGECRGKSLFDAVRKDIQSLEEKREEEEEEAGEEGEEEEEYDYKNVREVANAAFQEFDTEKERQLAYDIVDKATDVNDAKKILKRLHEEEEWRDGGDEEGEEDREIQQQKRVIVQGAEEKKGGLQTPSDTTPPALDLTSQRRSIRN